MTEMFHIPVVQTLHADTKLLGEMVRVLLCKLLKERLQFGIGGGMGHTWLQFCQRGITSIYVAGDLQRKVYVGIIPGETRRHDANDRVILVD